MPQRALTYVCVVLLLALTPAAAFADGAGDQQYQDPLAAPTAPKKPKKKKTTTTAPTSTSTTPAATTAPAATTSPTSTSATQPASSTTSSKELPRTGAPAGLIALLGIALIASGATLRRRTTSQ